LPVTVPWSAKSGALGGDFSFIDFIAPGEEFGFENIAPGGDFRCAISIQQGQNQSQIP